MVSGTTSAAPAACSLDHRAAGDPLSFVHRGGDGPDAVRAGIRNPDGKAGGREGATPPP